MTSQINHVTVLETERLILREFDASDAAALSQVFADPYARQFYAAMADRGAAGTWIERNIERYQRDGHGLWAACLRETGELVGDCGLISQSIQGFSEMEIAYHIRADCRGRGLATEAARACLEIGFSDLRAPRLVSMVHPANGASRTVASRVHRGYGRLMRHGAHYYLFSTTASEWEARRPRSGGLDHAT